MSNAAVMNYEERQVVFAQGEVDRYLYKIMSGKVGLYLDYGTSNERLVGTSSAPHYIGAMNALVAQPATYTAVALTKAMLLKLPEEEMFTFAKSDPGSAVDLMKTLARRLVEMQEAMGIASGEQCILDEYEEYVPVPEPAPVLAPVPALEEKRFSVAPAPQVVQSAFANYLPGHRGYPGVTHPEYKKYLISVDYTCPHCRAKFKGDKILTSKLIPVRHEAEELRYDLRVSYRDFETEWYEIVTCPHCCFTAFENHFKEGTSLYKSRYESKLVEFCENMPLDQTQERNLDFVFAQHYLALLCAPGFADWRQINARVWMNLIRLYKDAGEQELSDVAERKAVDAYQTVYMECELQPGQEQRLCLTVAGMLYARGEKREARVWASRVRSGSGDRSAYWNMAEQLIQDVRAEMETGEA